jgi:hypothetical protein
MNVNELLTTLTLFKLPLLVLALVLGALLAYLRVGPGRESIWMRRDGKQRERLRSRPMLDEKAAAAREFQLAVGMDRQRYLRIVFAATAVAFAAGFVLLGSWGVGTAAAIAAFGFLMGRASGAVTKLRSGLLADEVVPAARGLASAMAAGSSLTAAVGDFARGVPETPLRLSLRRALADPRGLEDGLRAESGRRDQAITIVEFFELLAEGASTARETATVAETLERFADVSQRQRTSFQAAMRATSEARGTRSIVALIIPAGVLVNFFTTGGENVRSPMGNILVIVTAILLYLSFVVTDRIIRGALKGF